MEIVVEGKGKVEYQPEIIKIRLTFDYTEKTYDKALETGTDSFENFVKNVLPKLNLKKEDLKTNKFSIEHRIDEDYRTNKKIDIGYNFQQEANLKVDYSNENINTFMTEIIKLDKIPEYNITFDIKDRENASKEALKKAYEESKNKANLIAIASGKKIKECKRTDFKPIGDIHCISIDDSEIEGSGDLEIPGFMRKKKDIFGCFTESFEPENIVIMENIYSLWIAE
jgi:uncharacterized protein YggE